jgi:hypothetical protein
MSKRFNKWTPLLIRGVYLLKSNLATYEWQLSNESKWVDNK